MNNPFLRSTTSLGFSKLKILKFVHENDSILILGFVDLQEYYCYLLKMIQILLAEKIKLKH
jgi:hypothetical protein